MSNPRHASDVRQGVLRTVVATGAFCLLHSALASRPAKAAFERRLGTRARNAFYRPMFNAVAIVTSGLLAGFLWRQPARTMYKITGPWSFLAGAGQALAGGAAVVAAGNVGVLRLGGLKGMAHWAAGAREVPREPEGQTINPSADGTIHPRGPFRWSRQPLNFWPIPLIWLKPHMTTTAAAFNTVATLYFYVGSLHSERRLALRYGTAYQAYQHSGVGFFLPINRPPRSHRHLRPLQPSPFPPLTHPRTPPIGASPPSSR